MVDDGRDRGNGLTPEEAAAFEALRQEAQPGDALKTRVIGALRDEGLLDRATGREARALHRPGRRRPGAGWWLGAAAAALVLFFGGLAAGQALGSRATTDAVLAAREASPSAARVQQTGSMYVAALQALAEEGAYEERERAAGREVARAILTAAAMELARLDPDDSRPALILEVLDTDRRADLPGGIPRGPRTIRF